MIIVTGASSGIGKEICLSLIKRGKNVLGIARTELNEEFASVSCDVGDFYALKQIARQLRKDKKPVTGLVNAAGIASMNLATATDPVTTQAIIQTNLLGTIYSCQAFSPLIFRQKTGAIINFSTIAVHLGLKGEAIYVASKAGVEGFTRSFAREASDFGVSVNCIAPGPIDTKLIQNIPGNKITDIINQQIVQRKITMPELTATVDMLLTAETCTLTGQTINLGGI